MGRRLAFNATLFLAGVFGIAAGAAPTWIGACALYACIGLGVGGNLPVDGALFLVRYSLYLLIQKRSL